MAEQNPFVVDGEAVAEEGVEYMYVEEGVEYTDVPAGEEGAEVVYEEVAMEGAEAADGEVVYGEEVPAEGELVAEEAAADDIVLEEAAEDDEVLDVAGDEAGLMAGVADDALAMEMAVEEDTPAPVVRRPVAVQRPAPVAAAPAAPAASAAPAALAAAKGAKGAPGAAKGKGKDLVKGKIGEKGGTGKDSAKAGKGKDGKGKDGKGKEGKGDENLFFGLIYAAGAKTGNMLIRCWKATDHFGQEVMIPAKLNPAGAKVGDRVSFEIVQGKEGGRPIAVKTTIRGHVDKIQERGENAKGTQEDIRRQVLYYFSDENLKKDAFFQKLINESGGISMATIIGCPKMKQMGATPENVKSAIAGCTEVEVGQGPDGAEAIKRTAPPPELIVAATAATAAAPQDDVTFPPPCATDLFYTGRVKPKRGWKFFVECEAVTAEYGGKDAWFHPKQKPESVDSGSLIVFTLAPDQDGTFAPRAAFVAAVAGEGAAAGAGGGKAVGSSGKAAGGGGKGLERRPSSNAKGGGNGKSGPPAKGAAKGSPVAKGGKGGKSGLPAKGAAKGGKPSIAKAGGVQRTIQKHSSK